MLKAIKSEIRLSGKSTLFGGIFTLGMYIFGLVMLVIILKLEPEEETTFFPMGSLMAILGGVLGQVLFDGAYFGTGFCLAAAMGRRRLPQIAAHALVALARMAVLTGVVYLLMCLDALLARSVYASREVEFDLRTFVSPGIVLAYIVAPVIISLLVSAVKVRFGARGWTVMYIIVFFGGMLAPRFVDLAIESPEHPLSRVLRAIFLPLIEIMTPALGIALAVVACLLILLFAFRLFMRAQINIE